MYNNVISNKNTICKHLSNAIPSFSTELHVLEQDAALGDYDPDKSGSGLVSSFIEYLKVISYFR
jgi:hypothetical protein